MEQGLKPVQYWKNMQEAARSFIPKKNRHLDRRLIKNSEFIMLNF